MAAEHVKQIDNQFVNTKNGSTDLSSMGSSTTGEQLLQASLNTNFALSMSLGREGP
jgi:hypothetical protein